MLFTLSVLMTVIEDASLLIHVRSQRFSFLILCQVTWLAPPEVSAPELI